MSDSNTGAAFSLDDFIEKFSKMPDDDQRDIIMGDHDLTDENGLLEIVEDKINGSAKFGHARWVVMRHRESGDLIAIHYRIHHSEGFQDAGSPVRVRAVEKTVVEYVQIVPGAAASK